MGTVESRFALSLLELIVLLLHEFDVRLVGLRVAFIHENATILLVAKSHDAALVIYYVEELVDDFLVLQIDAGRQPDLVVCVVLEVFNCLLALDKKAHLTLVLGVVVLSCGSGLLELDAVDLVDEGLLHLGRDGHVDMHNISILLSELLVDLDGLEVYHGFAWRARRLRIHLALVYCLRQLLFDLLLQFLVRHDR